jgi:hypothetical protein
MTPRLAPLLMVLALVSPALGGCFMAKDMTDVGQQVTAFHRQLDAGQFDQIYAAASDDLKRTSTQDRFNRFLAAVHRKLGATGKAQQTGFNDTMNTSGHYVVLNYHTTFAQGDGTESFTYSIVNGTPKLAAYQINSETLVLN